MPALLELVRRRRSIRRFLPRPVAREDLLVCLEAARLAPSASNSQPWRFLVVDDPELKEDLCREAFTGIYSVSRFAAQAPVILAVLARQSRSPVFRLGQGIQRTQFYLIDIGIAVEHFVLQAEELGLATCWMGWFNAKKARRALRVPRTYKIAALLPVGYAASRPPRETVRKPLEEVAWFNGIGKEEMDPECRNNLPPES
jgi:nitroreductase